MVAKFEGGGSRCSFEIRGGVGFEIFGSHFRGWLLNSRGGVVDAISRGGVGFEIFGSHFPGWLLNSRGGLSMEFRNSRGGRIPDFRLSLSWVVAKFEGG